MKILKSDCKPECAKDTSLPYTAYLIKYDSGEGIKYDIAISAKKVEIFDYYWDNYRSVISMTQSDGKCNPKLWKEAQNKNDFLFPYIRKKKFPVFFDP